MKMEKIFKKPAHVTSATAVQKKDSSFFGKTSGGRFFEDTKQDNAPIIQAKRTVNQPGDAHEKEADQVAEQVMRAPTQLVQRQGGSKQPQPQKKTMQEYNMEALQKSFKEWAITDKILDPMARAIAKSYANRPGGKLELPERVIENTPYGGRKVTPAIRQPSEERIVNALKPQMKLKKIGKGNDPKDWTWTWRDGSAYRAKTADEKVQEVGKWAAEEYFEDKVEKKFITPLVKPVVESAAKWLVERELLATTLLLTGAGEVIAVGMLVYSIADLLLSLDEPVEKELSPYQQTSTNIVEGVKDFLQAKQDAEDRKKELARPFQPYKTVSDDPPVINIPQIPRFTK